MNNTSDLPQLNQRKQELEQRIKALMKDIKPLKQELEQVTDAIYRIECEQARDLPVWELRINPAKTLREAGFDKKLVLCSGVTWQEMYDTAVKYFDENGITGWTVWENDGYKDCGQFCYADGYNGGPVLGTFDMVMPHQRVIRAFDFEGI